MKHESETPSLDKLSKQRMREDDIINAVKMLQEKNLGFKSKEKAIVTISTVSLMREYYNQLIMFHTECNKDDKHKISAEIESIGYWLKENKGTKIKM